MKREEPVAAVRLGEGELARRGEDGRVHVRETPLRVRFELDELVTSDGHRLKVGFGCAVLARPERAERRMFEEALLDGVTSCGGADVVRVFMPRVAGAAGTFVATRAATDVLAVGVKDELANVLRKAVDAAGFAAGLEAMPPYQLDVESPSMRRMEAERAARLEAEREQAERLEHLRRAAAVVKEFDAIRAASPGASVSDVVSRMSQADQAGVVQRLLEASTGSAGVGTLYAVAGPHLVRVGTGDLSVEIVPVPADVGPFRSLQATGDGDGRLALGGRGGVVLLDPAVAAEAQVYAARDVVSTMGFNRVVVFDGRVYASHSEVGIVAWDVSAAPGESVARLAVSGGARNLHVAGGRLVYSSGGAVAGVDRALRPAGTSPAAGEAVVALLPTRGGLVVVREDGVIELLDPMTLEAVRSERRAPRLTAGGLMPFYDSPRIVVATEDGPVLCLSTQDSVVTQYASPHRGLKAITAAGGTIVGVSTDRQRLVFLDAGGGKPVREVYVGARVRHRVGEIAFVR